MASWKNAKKQTPPTTVKFGESEFVLCLSPDNSTPFVGWYNENDECWRVAHWKADSLPVPVTYWRELPKVPNA